MPKLTGFLTVIYSFTVLQLLVLSSQFHIPTQHHLSSHNKQKTGVLSQNEPHQYQKISQKYKNNARTTRSLQTVIPLSIRVRQFTNEQLQERTLQDQKQSLLEGGQSLDQIFSGLPTQKQLNQMVQNTDVFVISKTVQLLVTKNNLDCQLKLIYLSMLKDLILHVASERKYELNKARIIENNAQAEMKRLLTQLNEELQKLSQLNTREYEQKMNIQIQSLQYIYDLHNQVSLQLNVTKSRLLKMKPIIQQKEILFENMIEQRTNLTNNRSRQNVQQRKNRINELSLRIYSQEQFLAQIQNDFLLYETYLDRKTIQSDSLRRIYLELEVEVQRTRQIIYEGKIQKARIRERIDAINQELSVHRKNSNSGLPQSLQTDINKLQAALPNLQQQFDILNYYCYDLDIQNAQDYEESIDIFRDYVQQTYKIDPTRLEDIEGIQTIHIIPIDIFSSRWKQQFGQTTKQDIIIVNVGLPNGGTIEYNFNCIRPSTIIRGSEKTTNIFNSCLIVRDQNDVQYNLHVGICSPLEGSQQELEGQRIFWKGNELEREVQLYTGSCL